MSYTHSPFNQQQWVEFRNDSGEQIPAFGCVRITGVAVIEPGRVVLTVAKPNTYGAQSSHAISGPVPVNASRYGFCTRNPFAVALYDTADGTPAFAEKWGPRSASWKLKKNTGGFAIQGLTKSSAGLVLVVPAPMLSFVGKTAASLAKGATGTINIWAGALGSETDQSVAMTGVYNRFAAVASGKWVRCEWNHQSSDWELVAAEC